MEGTPSCCRLRWHSENACLEVNCRKMPVGNQILLWNDDPLVPGGAHSTFSLNEDGSISPHSACPGTNAGDPQSLVLSLRDSTFVLVRRDDPKRLLFEEREPPPCLVGPPLLAGQAFDPALPVASQRRLPADH